LAEVGDIIEIDIPKRILCVNISGAELSKRRAALEDKGASAWKPATRTRKVSQALQAYAALTTSASRNAVRDGLPHPEVAHGCSQLNDLMNRGSLAVGLRYDGAQKSKRYRIWLAGVIQ
jgi:hypothetical protein